jgi:alpha-beta hydrolase superfamily lysophospholipase
MAQTSRGRPNAPLAMGDLAPGARPAATYGEAMERVAALHAQDASGPPLAPVCFAQMMTHERKVERAIVLLHGYTTCPQQFHEFGQLFHARGYNVLIPRLPHHGHADRMSTASALITAAALARLTDEAADIAHGLGEHVTLAGFSAGGVMTAWAAQHRDDLDLAVIMSPALGVGAVPAPLTTVSAHVSRLLPDTFIWWDPRTKERIPGAQYGYPRFSAHGLSEILLLGAAVRREAARRPPAARSILVVTNASDLAINNQVTKSLVRAWRRQGARRLRTYEFPLTMGLFHDYIGPEQPYQKVNTVYPILLDLILPAGTNGATRSASAEPDPGS